MHSLVLLALSLALPADTSGPDRVRRSEWKDSEGRRVVRIDRGGKSFFFVYDPEGRIITTLGTRRKVARDERSLDALKRDYWEHRFRYEDSRLIEETDCFGQAHGLKAGAAIDPAKASTLKGHRHLWGPSPKVPANRVQVFLYDPAGRVRKGVKSQSVRPEGVREE